MFGNQPFGFQLLRKYVASFGTLFSQIQIVREEPALSGKVFPITVADEGKIDQFIRVPLEYSAKDKLLARIAADPGIDRPDAQLLPRIAFQMTSMGYASDRKLRSRQRYAVTENITTEIYKEVLDPVPYDLNFTVLIATKYQMEGNQIIEQILPYFTPSFPLKLEIIPEMNIITNSDVFLKSVTCSDSYDGKYEERRAIVWTLEFTMQALLFGPIRQHPIIKFANTNMYDSTRFANIGDAVGNSTPVDRVTVQPGITANGLPTKNVALSIDFHLIHANSNWGYIVNDYGTIGVGEGRGGEINNYSTVAKLDKDFAFGFLGVGYY